eukprot:2768371-Prorocentrum_lima.AAC.1
MVCLPATARSGSVVTYNMHSLHGCCKVLHRCSTRQVAILQRLPTSAQRATDVDVLVPSLRPDLGNVNAAL